MEWPRQSSPSIYEYMYEDGIKTQARYSEQPFDRDHDVEIKSKEKQVSIIKLGLTEWRVAHGEK